MGTALAHMLRGDASATDRSGTTDDATDHGTGGPASPWSVRWSLTDQAAGPRSPTPPEERTRSPRRNRGDAAGPDTAHAARTARNTYPEPDESRLIARRLAAAGKPVSRRTLRSNGATGSSAQLGTLARTVNAELAAAAAGKRAAPSG